MSVHGGQVHRGRCRRAARQCAGKVRADDEVLQHRQQLRQVRRQVHELLIEPLDLHRESLRLVF
jgi:hypothetical protein